MDFIVRCDKNFRLNEGLIGFLQVNRKATLDQIINIVNKNMWELAWLGIDDLKIPGIGRITGILTLHL